MPFYYTFNITSKSMTEPRGHWLLRGSWKSGDFPREARDLDSAKSAPQAQALTEERVCSEEQHTAEAPEGRPASGDGGGGAVLTHRLPVSRETP